MSTFDIFLLVVVGAAAAIGFWQGILKQLGSLAGIVLGIMACRLWGPAVEQWLTTATHTPDNQTLMAVMAYVGLFIVVYVAVSVVALAVRKVAHAVLLGSVDRIAGAAFKAVLWVFVLSLAINVWCTVEPEDAPQGPWAERVMAFAPAVIGSPAAQELLHPHAQ